MHIPTAAPAPVKPLPIYRQLYFQVIVAIVLGAILGHYEPLIGEKMKPLGDAFINLVKMIIAPVIFLTIVTGIASMTHLRTVGRVFAKAMAYFLFFSTLALIVGMIVAHVVQPGAGPIWPQVLAVLYAYGAFLAVLVLALLLRPRWLDR